LYEEDRTQNYDPGLAERTSYTLPVVSLSYRFQ